MLERNHVHACIPWTNRFSAKSVIRETVVLFIAYQLTFLFEFAVNLVSLVFDLIQVN